MQRREKAEKHAVDWELEAYKQGSETCRNYSRLISPVRTIIITFVSAAIGAVTLKWDDMSDRVSVLMIAGTATSFMGIVLLLIDWHFQSAFEAIRDTNAITEAKQGVKGPWLAHFKVREPVSVFLASYLPLLLLIWGGATVMFASIWMLDMWWRDISWYDILSHDLWGLATWWLARNTRFELFVAETTIYTVTCFAIVFFFMYRAYDARRRHQKIIDEIEEIEAKRRSSVDKRPDLDNFFRVMPCRPS